jgi:hypothetical protein
VSLLRLGEGSAQILDTVWRNGTYACPPQCPPPHPPQSLEPFELDLHLQTACQHSLTPPGTLQKRTFALPRLYNALDTLIKSRDLTHVSLRRWQECRENVRCHSCNALREAKKIASGKKEKESRGGEGRKHFFITSELFRADADRTFLRAVVLAWESKTRRERFHRARFLLSVSSLFSFLRAARQRRQSTSTVQQC